MTVEDEIARLRRELDRLAPQGPVGSGGWPIRSDMDEGYRHPDAIDLEAEERARAAAYAAMPTRKGSRVL